MIFFIHILFPYVCQQFLQFRHGAGDGVALGFDVVHQFRERAVVLFAALLDPSDVEAGLVAVENFFDAVFAPASLWIGFGIVGFGACIDVFGMISVDEIVEVMALKLVGGERVLHVGAVVVEPDFPCGLSFGEEEHVGLHALCIEDAGGQAEDGVEIEV